MGRYAGLYVGRYVGRYAGRYVVRYVARYVGRYAGRKWAAAKYVSEDEAAEWLRPNVAPGSRWDR